MRRPNLAQAIAPIVLVIILVIAACGSMLPNSEERKSTIKWPVGTLPYRCSDRSLTDGVPVVDTEHMTPRDINNLMSELDTQTARQFTFVDHLDKLMFAACKEFYSKIDESNKTLYSHVALYPLDRDVPGYWNQDENCTFDAELVSPPQLGQEGDLLFSVDFEGQEYVLIGKTNDNCQVGGTNYPADQFALMKSRLTQ